MKSEQIVFFNDFIKEYLEYPTQEKQEEESKDINEGDEVIYLKDGHTKDEYDPKKSVDEQDEVVGQKVVKRIEGGNYIFEDRDGNEFTKSEDEILQKVENEESEESEDETQETQEETQDEESNESLTIKKFFDFK